MIAIARSRFREDLERAAHDRRLLEAAWPSRARRQAGSRRFGSGRTRYPALVRVQDAVLAQPRSAARALARRPALALTAILILGVGIGATTAVFSVFHGTLLRPLPFPGQERLFVV